MRRECGSRGFTLLEVLIALLVFSLGLLGMAGLLMVSVKTNQSAYLRTQASFLAQGMADRMRANRSVINTYNGTYSSTTTAPDPCVSPAACSAADIVKRDTKVWWSNQLLNQLPNSTGTINCVGGLLGSTLQSVAAPYDGLCSIVIKWSEAKLDRGTEGGTAVAATPTTQTFAWVFQP